MNTKEAIYGRRSIRKYEPCEVPQEDIKEIISAAMHAPSAVNSRPWEFYVIRDQKVKEQLVEAHPYAAHLLKASFGIVVCGVPEKREKIGYMFWPLDCGAAIENMLLMAKELGYGSCWCGIYPAEDRVNKVQDILKTENIPVAIIPFGKAAEEPGARGYYDEEIVHWM